jgi:hypothetical protein
VLLKQAQRGPQAIVITTIHYYYYYTITSGLYIYIMNNCMAG